MFDIQNSLAPIKKETNSENRFRNLYFIGFKEKNQQIKNMLFIDFFISKYFRFLDI